LEYCDVGDLSSFIKERHLRRTASASSSKTHILFEHEASYVVRDIVRGLAHLQLVCKVMHRDIKLDNILVKRKNANQGKSDKFSLPIDCYEFKLGDLGLAKNMTRESQLHETICGTPLNMAPEVLKGDLYDLKADVWSLGTVLFQMLTGEYPFGGRDYEDLKANIGLGIYKVPKHVQVSPSCLDFLNSCLRFKSDKRKSWD